MSQLNKEQIDAVAEWILTKKWGISGLQNSVVMEEVKNRFIEDFYPKGKSLVQRMIEAKETLFCEKQSENGGLAIKFMEEYLRSTTILLSPDYKIGFKEGVEKWLDEKKWAEEYLKAKQKDREKPTVYILQKDLPDSRPGDKYIWNDSQRAYYKDGNVLDSYWMPEYVENQTDWFLPEKKEDKIPIWELWDSNNKKVCVVFDKDMAYKISAAMAKIHHTVVSIEGPTNTLNE